MSEWADLESELNSIGGATTTGSVSVINNNINSLLYYYLCIIKCKDFKVIIAIEEQAKN